MLATTEGVSSALFRPIRVLVSSHARYTEHSKEYQSLLLAKESNTSKAPLVDHGVLIADNTFSLLALVITWGLRLEVELGAQVSVLTHGVLVYGARVHVLVIYGRFLGCSGSLLFGRWALSVHLDVGEGKEEVFTLGVLEETLGFVPGSALKPESVDPDSLSRLSNVLTFNAGIVSNDGVARVSDFSSGLYGIQSPVVSSVSTGDLLHDGSQESLGIEESSQPERDGPVLSQPVRETEVSVGHGSEPSGQGGCEPSDFSTRGIEEPHGGDTQIEDELDASSDLRGHDNLTIDSKAHVGHPLTDNSKNVLETLDLLEEEHDQRDGFTSLGQAPVLHGLQSVFYI